MTTFLATLLVFLSTAIALGLGRTRGRDPNGRCDGCAAREAGGCDKPRMTRHEAGEDDDSG